MMNAVQEHEIPQHVADGDGLAAEKCDGPIEIMRLEGLVKKLQSELQAEREYSRALEDHVKTLQEAD